MSSRISETAPEDKLQGDLANLHIGSSSAKEASDGTTEEIQDENKSTQLFPLMELPDEVREQILGHVVNEPGRMIIFGSPKDAPTTIELPYIMFMGNRKLYHEALRATLMSTILEVFCSRTDGQGVHHWLTSMDLSLVSSNQKTGFDAIQKLSFPKFGHMLKCCWDYYHKDDLAFAAKCKNLRELTLGFQVEDVIDWKSDGPGDMWDYEKSGEELHHEYRLEAVLGFAELEVLAFVGYCSDKVDQGILDLGRYLGNKLKEQIQMGARKTMVKIVHRGTTMREIMRRESEERCSRLGQAA